MKTVGILVFDDVEISTFADAAALFSPTFRTLLLAETSRAVICDGGFQLQPQATILDHPPLDVLLIPGGRGHSDDWSRSRLLEWMEVLFSPEGKGVRRERYNERLMNWIREQSLQVETIVGICSGTVLLAECGLLTGCQATTHPSLVPWMRTHYPQVLLTPEDSFVSAGRVLTAAGWKSALEASLHVIARTHGARAAVTTALRVDPRGKWLDSVGGAAAFAAR